MFRFFSLVAALLIAAGAVLLPWFGGEFSLLGRTVHLHSLKNPFGGTLVLLGLLSLLPPGRRTAQSAAARLEEWSRTHPREIPWLVCLLSGAVITSAKLFQHFSLQTNAFDLGVFANVSWNTLHGRFFYDSVKGTHYLADHFQPVLLLLAPLLWIWKNAGVLLVAQSAALALAAPPLYMISKARTGSATLGLLLCLFYLSRPSLNALSAFDMHPETLAIPLFLWAIRCFESGRPGWGMGLALSTLSLKEDLPIALAAFALAWAAQAGLSRRRAAVLTLAAAAAFLMETQAVIPHFLKAHSSVHMDRYAHLGASYGEIFLNAFRDPARWAGAALSPASKWWDATRFLGSFAFLPLLHPVSLLPAAAALLPHWLSRYPGQYGLSGHYTAVALPFLLYGSVRALERLLGRRPSPAWLYAGLLVLSGGAFLTNARYARPSEGSRLREFRTLLRQIPPEASIRAQGSLLPHVCLRERSPLFAPYERYKDLPLFEDSRHPTDYVLLDVYGNLWPMEDNLFKEELFRLQEEGRYELVEFRRGFQLWKRRVS